MDLIERQAAISAMEGVDWYHIDKDGQLVHGANSKEDEPLYKASDVYAVLNQMPPAQPDLDEVYAHAETEAEARYHAERKKGKWINIREGNRADCDQCGQSGRAWMNFCFGCGADMREGAERRTDDR